MSATPPDMLLLQVRGHEAFLTEQLGRQIGARLRIDGNLGRARHSTLFAIPAGALDETELGALGERLSNPVSEEHRAGALTLPAWVGSALLVAKRPGVTDDRARMAERVTEHCLGRPVRLSSASLFEIERELSSAQLRELGETLLGNPLVEQAWIHRRGDALDLFTAEFVRASSSRPPAPPSVTEVQLPERDEDLLALSRTRELSLSLDELHAIAAYYAEPARISTRVGRGLPAGPTDAELEMLAQTWSEHCKHKEFGAKVRVEDAERGHRVIDSIFKSTIVAATQQIRGELAACGADWLLSVFSDNAGVVAYDAEHAFVLKVETHNSPSALEPFGGALTGILGNNRDPLGTGRGGAKLLFNTNVLCFGPLDHADALLPGQLHPRVIYEGVLAGIRAGGNHSGVPTVNGAVLFDPRFAGKPLVYCGTGALMPKRDVLGAPLYEKHIEPGQLVVMIGGRVGRDGIHGATFSSRTMDERAPRSVVQIGSPITQKRVADLLREACPLGLVAAATDNGAGGLASSVGELAMLSFGARIDLAKVPLKAEGLLPWEILVSESQERMTLALDRACLARFEALAALHEVEVSVLGEFTNDGLFEAVHGEAPVCLLDLQFLHDGWPRLELPAIVAAPARRPWQGEAPSDLGALLLRLLAAPNIASRERIVRRYDHEVQARTVLKPYMGRAPQDAAVLRLGKRDHDGLAVASGVCPQYGDLDPYQASACAFDEAVRSVVAVGARLPFGDDVHDFVCACDNFCMPNVRYDVVSNPDGPEKLGKLVRMAEALFEVATAFRVPLVSGKDSMKNDFRSVDVDGTTRTVSVPPTVLYTVVAKLRDTRRIVTAELKREGHVLYLLRARAPRREDSALGGEGLGASEVSRLLGGSYGAVPTLDLAAARELYRAMGQAHDASLFASCHDVSDGGVAVAVAEACLGGGLGARLENTNVDLGFWFGEAPSRFVVSLAREREAELLQMFGDRAVRLGVVGGDRLTFAGSSLRVQALADAYEGGALP